MPLSVSLVPVGDVVDGILDLANDDGDSIVGVAKDVAVNDVAVSVTTLFSENTRFRGCGHQGDHGKDSSHFAVISLKLLLSEIWASFYNQVPTAFIVNS